MDMHGSFGFHRNMLPFRVVMPWDSGFAVPDLGYMAQAILGITVTTVSYPS